MELNIELLERKVDTKDKKIPQIVIYQLEEIKKHYDENLELIRKQFPIAEKLLEDGNKEAAETIWRTQIVLLASAFDFFMHEIVWYGLDKIYDGEWQKTEQYQNLTIRLEILQKAMENPESKEWFSDYITEKYKKQTLMEFGDVKDHLNLIGVKIEKVAEYAFHERGCMIRPRLRMKQKLNDLYNRRNHIAHQSDRSERNAEQKAISKEQVYFYIEDVNKIVAALIQEVKKM